MRKRRLSFVLAVLMIATLLPVTALAYTTYYINGVAVRCDDFDSSPNECWTYANNIYNKIWGQQFNSLFDDSANSLRNLSDSELTLTAEHLRNYVSNAALGSALRICSSEYLHGGDGWGHSQIIVQKDSNGFTVLQGGLSASPYRNERYYTWSEYLNSWNYAYIKYIKWPGAPAYGGGTVTPDPGLSVKETINCRRKIKLPARVVNLYSNPTDTTRFTYFSDGPTAYSSRYAIMSDGSIMYEVGANHQGQDMKLWLQYASDMTVTKEHTYGSTQYESAHPHRGYRVCECGDKTYTGETTTRDDCSECGGEVKYAVEGGYLTFDKKTGTVTDCDSSVTKANIPHTIKGATVTCIGNGAFGWCKSLTGVTIPDSVTSIGGSAFYGCTSLTSVTIPDSVTSIGGSAFGNCKSLTNMTIPDSVTLIGNGAFLGCTSLTSVTIPDSVTSIGERAFSECTSLTSVTIPDSVTSIGEQAFSECTSLTSVTIPDSVTSIGEQAFSECTSLTSVTIPDSVTSIGDGAFASCTSLTGIWVAEGNNDYSSDASGVLFNKDKITLVQCPGTFREYTIPDSVTSIGEQAFMGCSSLTSVTIPDSVTSIHWGAFYDCTSLTSVTIPDSVTSIGAWAFRDCTSLTDVYYAGSEAQWKAISISSTENDDLLTANIHYNYVSHTHSYKDVVTAPTCTEKGHTTHTCSCGDSYVDTYTDPLGHDLKDDAAVAATCTTAGTTAGKHCTRCDYKEGMETIAALGHDLKDDAAVAATCTTAGTTAGKHCTRCDYKEGMETIAALGHAWDEGMVTKEATETTQGSMTYTCTRCQATKRDILPASGLVATAVYNDVKNDTSWFYPGVQYCLSYGLMSGMGNGSFAPGEYTTRAQVAQILYNLHGNPEVSGGTPFTDVPEGAWYQKAVTWAHSVGIVNGVTATTFSPNANITRQDFVLMLMRYLNNVRMVDRTWKPDDLSRFVDAGSVGFWALDAMKDAVAINAISGVTVDGRLCIQPARNATRAEAAKILMVFHETMTK